MGIAAPIIGGVGTVAGLVGQSNSQAQQAQAAADQQSLLAKQAFYNQLALNAAQTNLAYDYNTAELQQKSADLQATQQNFQNLTQAREQAISTSGQVDQARFQAQQQYSGTLFGQGQQSGATAFQATQDANNKLFGVGVQGLQAQSQVTQQGMEGMFNTAQNSMGREKAASDAGLSNILQTGASGINDTTQTMLTGANNVFNTANQYRDNYTNADVALSDTRSQGYQEGAQLNDQLAAQALGIREQQTQLGQQQSAMEAMYSAMVGSNLNNTLSGRTALDRQTQQGATTQQRFEGMSNTALGRQQRDADYRTQTAQGEVDRVGALGDLDLGYQSQLANIGNQNAAQLSGLSDLNSLANYNRDVNNARSLGSIDQTNAALQFALANNNVQNMNQLGVDYQGYQNALQSGFLRDYLATQDEYVRSNAGNQLQQTNQGLNSTLNNALTQQQLSELAYQQGAYQINNQSQANMAANKVAKQTGEINASLQSEANATLNQAQQAALKMQQAGMKGPNVFDYANAGIGIISAFQKPQQQQQQQSYNFNTPNMFNNGSLYGGGQFNTGMNLYGSGPMTYSAASPSLGLGSYNQFQF